MRQLKIGGMRIDRLVEIAGCRSTRNWLFANVDDEVIAANRDWLDERYIEPGSGRFILSHHSYVVRTPRWTAVVDTCCGNHKERPRVPVWHQLNQPYLDNMQALGVRPEDVDFVMCTHLHVDHVGWNTRLVDGRWVPTFPSARYLMGAHRIRSLGAGSTSRSPTAPVNHGSFEDSVLPVVAAGQAEFVRTDHCLFDDREADLRFVPAPGHTIGNMMIDLQRRPRSRGHVRRRDPSPDPVRGAVAVERRRFRPRGRAGDAYQACSNSLRTHQASCWPAHFPAPTAGRVVSHGDAFRFQFEED